jgi:hypothetical protein
MTASRRLHLLFYGVVGLGLCWDHHPVVVMAQNSTTTNATTTTTTGKQDGNDTEDDDPLCFTTFRDLSAAIAAKADFVQETFVICAGTVINVGVETYLGSGEFVNGDVALAMRQFTRVNCGADGSSRNNCVVRGGNSHVYVNSFSYRTEDKQRMTISGFTFEESDQWSIWANYNAAELLVLDCTFRKVQGVLYGTALLIQEIMVVTFRNCTFIDNVLAGQYGLFDVDDGGVHLTITDSVIVNNTFTSDTKVRFIYVYW